MSNYLKLFETTNEYTQYIEQGSPLLPNVSYTEDALKVYYNPIPHDYSKDYFTIVVTEGGNIVFDMNNAQGLSISKDNGETWEEVGNEGIDVSEGDTILVKCMLSDGYEEDYYNFIRTSESFKAKIQGNIMSLLVSDDFMNATVIENSYLSGLFKNSEWLIEAQNLVLPATTLAENCYNDMFVNCTSLVTAPVLPATTLAEGCYASMFRGCSNLVTAPVLPVTTLAENCYYCMFYGCISLVTAPELPATTLADNCYESMFNGCSNLVYAPKVLPATTLAKYCYYNMFSGCTSLNYVKAMFTTVISQYNSYTSEWLNNVSTTGTFVGNAEASWLDDVIRTTSTVPEGWTIEKE